MQMYKVLSSITDKLKDLAHYNWKTIGFVFEVEYHIHDNRDIL